MNIDPYKKSTDSRQAKINTLTTELSEAENQRDTVTSQIKQMREELEQAYQSLKTSQTAAEALSIKLSQAKLRETELSTELDAWMNRIIERDKTIFTLRRELNQKRIDAEAYQAGLETELRNMQAGHDHTIADLHNAYKTSTSWRVSAPVRFIGRLIRRHQDRN